MVVVDSPAKLNLTLRLIRKRRDGYHELVTLFHRISLRDTLRLHKRSESIRVICPNLRVPKNKNLIVQAFDLLKKVRPFSGGVMVHLTKRIPVGGGLGGGSSNAAHFLMGMNHLFRLGLTQKKLMKLGRKLGSDIPFFISGARHAMGRGRGERIQPLSLRRKLWFLLLVDTRGLSTKKVYAGFHPFKRAVSLTGVTHSVRIASAFLEQGNLKQASKLLLNDLTQSAEGIRPSLKKTRETLSGLHLGTCQMSGSGPTLFIVFTSREKAQGALRQLRNLRFSQQTLICHSF